MVDPCCVGLRIISELSLEPSNWRTALPGIVLYLLAAVCLISAILRKGWALPNLKSDHEDKIYPAFRVEFLLIGLILAVFAFLLFGSGEFGFINTSLWILSLVFMFLAFWQGRTPKVLNITNIWNRLLQGEFQIKINRWGLIVLAVIAVILFFNFHRLEAVPPEMVSDQAEKLLDINDILNGYTPIYFPRNTGREVIHFYLTAAYMKLFNLEVSYLNLKVVAVFANLLTVFFIYLLGKEIGNKWVGLAAALFKRHCLLALGVQLVALRIPLLSAVRCPSDVFDQGAQASKCSRYSMGWFVLGAGLTRIYPSGLCRSLLCLFLVIYGLHKPGKTEINSLICAFTYCPNFSGGFYPLVALLAGKSKFVYLPRIFSSNLDGSGLSKQPYGHFFAEFLESLHYVLLG